MKFPPSILLVYPRHAPNHTSFAKNPYIKKNWSVGREDGATPQVRQCVYRNFLSNVSKFGLVLRDLKIWPFSSECDL